MFVPYFLFLNVKFNGTRPEEQRGTHLENYIVQDRKNKQVIQETVKQVGRICEAENESF